MNQLKQHFLLDPNVIFLNHGSFGAAPRVVMDEYQKWQRRLEHQPVKFLDRELFDHLMAARKKLSDDLICDKNDVVFIPNATYGVNLVTRSLQLAPDDEILTTNHEYGACEKILGFVSKASGVKIKKVPIPLYDYSSDVMLDKFWASVNQKTKLIFVSHITSSTSLCFPVEQICTRARNEDILTLIDGAHAPGQIPLDLTALDADFYTGNCHKWMLAPKGSGFLYTRQELQEIIIPLIVSWGWGLDSPFGSGSPYLDQLQWPGTTDPSALLSVPSAIQFQQDHDWEQVRANCHQLLGYALKEIHTLTSLPTINFDDNGNHRQMATAPLPPIQDIKGFQSRLYSEFNIEIPLIEWEKDPFIRISVQGYNSQSDIDALLTALAKILAEEQIH